MMETENVKIVVDLERGIPYAQFAKEEVEINLLTFAKAREHDHWNDADLQSVICLYQHMEDVRRLTHTQPEYTKNTETKLMAPVIGDINNFEAVLGKVAAVLFMAHLCLCGDDAYATHAAEGLKEIIGGEFITPVAELVTLLNDICKENPLPIFDPIRKERWEMV